MTDAPEISGFRLDQRLLEHPLAEIWLGRSFTGMDVVTLVLSETGAADPAVRARLDQASRTAALEPVQSETPLWAANLTADRPYAITQLVPGQAGAERLLDPLDGLLGNDAEAVAAVRSRLSRYGAVPLTTYPGTPGAARPTVGSAGTAEAGGGRGAGDRETNGGSGGGGKTAGWVYLVAGLVVLIVFSLAFSVGTALGRAAKADEQVAEAPPPAVVSPGALPNPVLLPGIEKPSGVTYVPPTRSTGLLGATYTRGADVQVVDKLGLPFTFGFPVPPVLDERTSTESSSMIYRRVLSSSDADNAGVDLEIAVRPCRDLAACLADRAAFDQEWTATYEAPKPVTAKDARTWYTVRSKAPYTLTMTHAFRSGDRWWLVGVAATGLPGEEPAVQRVVNDIWHQAG